MKLHLPKLLLTAVMAACVAPAFAADETWQPNNEGQRLLENDNTVIAQGDTVTIDASSRNDKTLAINGKSTHGGTHANGHYFTIVGTLNASDDVLRLESRAKMIIAGGSVTASAMQLGYSSDYQQDIWGAIEMTRGTLTTGTITLNKNWSNVVDIKGGSVEFTSAQALNTGNNSNSQIIIQGASSESDAMVKLLATTIDWTLDGGANVPVTVGNVAIDANNTHMITIANATLNGVINNAGKLTLRDVTVTNDVEVSGSGSLVIADTITNNGTLDLTGSNISLGDSLAAYKVKKDGSVTYSIDAEKQNGFMIQNGAQVFLVQGGDATVAEDAQASMGDTAYDLNSDETGIWFTTGNYTTSSFYISDGDVEVIGSGAENATGAEKYILQGGTMQLTAGTVDRAAIEYTEGGIVMGDTASVTGLTSLNDLALIATTIGGSGTIEVTGAAHWTHATEPDTAKKIEAAEGFTGTLYVKSGRFTYSDNRHGSVLKLGNGAHMQVNNGGELTNSLVLESGNHEVHVNGETTFNVTGSISGDGTFDKRGGDSKVYLKGSASVQNYKNTLGTTIVQDSASVTNLTNAGGTTNVTDGSVTTLSATGGTTNVTGGSVTTLSATGGTTNVSGGSVSNMMSTGGTTNITGTVSIGGGANFSSTHVSGIYLKENGSVNIGDGTSTNTVTVTRVEMGDNQSANGGVLNVKSNATLVVTGGDVTTGQNAYHKTGLLLGEWESASTVNVAGKLLAENATLFVGDKTANVVIDNGGILAVKGIGLPKVANDKTQAINLTLNDGGKVVLGEAGINTSKPFSGVLGAGTIGISADAAINTALAMKSSTGTTFDTQKYVWGEGGASITQGTDGGTLSISGVISDHSVTTTEGEGDSATTTTTNYPGKLVKAGAGTLELSGANTYTGGTDINAGTVKTGNATALGTGAVSVAEGASLELGASLTVSSDLTIAEGGSLIFGNGTTLTVTGTLTLDASAITFADDISFSSADAVTLATAGTLDVTGVDSWKGEYTIGESKYTAGLSTVDNVLSLTFTELLPPSTDPITTTVSDFELNGTALTLNVEEAVLSEGMVVNVHLLDDTMMKDILAKLDEGNYTDGKPMVTITLAGSESGTITANELNEVVFIKGDTGQNYWGEMVGGQLMYNVERIPEPTTATLSLLALMGLAARRRRQK